MAEPDPIPTIDDLTNAPRGRLMKPAEVIDLAAAVARRAEKFSGVLTEIEAGLRQRGEEAAASAAAAGFPPYDQRAAAARVMAKARAEVLEASDETRWAAIRELTAAADAVSATGELYASPQTVLARAGLGTPERSNYLAQLEGSGPVNLRNMAHFALATGNKVLGAALAQVVERMPAAKRPISVAQLAENLVGEETKAVQDALRRIRTATQAALNANRELTSGRARLLDRLSLALDGGK